MSTAISISIPPPCTPHKSLLLLPPSTAQFWIMFISWIFDLNLCPALIFHFTYSSLLNFYITVSYDLFYPGQSCYGQKVTVNLPDEFIFHVGTGIRRISTGEVPHSSTSSSRIPSGGRQPVQPRGRVPPNPTRNGDRPRINHSSNTPGGNRVNFSLILDFLTANPSYNTLFCSYRDSFVKSIQFIWMLAFPHSFVSCFLSLALWFSIVNRVMVCKVD